MFVADLTEDFVEIYQPEDFEVNAAESADAGEVTYYRYELKNAQITHYQIGADTDGDGVPEIDMSLNFEEIKVTYTECDSEGKSKGNVEMTWKVEEGEK